MKRACKTKEEKKIQEELVEIVEDVQPIQEQPIEDVVEEVQDEEVQEEVIDDVQEEERAEEDIINNVEDPVEEIQEEDVQEEEELIEEERIIEGYAIVFNELSEDLGGFREMIMPEAVTEELINNSDIYYLYNHCDNSIPLARCNHGQGSLELTIDDKGLKYRFNCLNTEFYELVKRGDLSKSSFAFSLPKDGSGEIWEKSSEYNYIRKITKIEQLFDCSAVLVPAYSQTELYARNLNKKEIDPSYYEYYDNIINQLSH